MAHVKYLAIFLLLWNSSAAQGSHRKQFKEVLGQHNEFSGVILLAENGRPVFYKARGFRDFAKKTPLRKKDIFELASVSKQFTAMVIMMLQQEGKLQYDDPVEKYLEIPYKGITIRHLLTHTSGLPDYQAIMDKYWDKSKVAGNTEILQYLNRYAPPKLFEPGEKYEYSNTGYVLLASIAEKASGKDFIDMCRNRIFHPLHMKRTDIRTLQQKASNTRFAIGHIHAKEREKYIRADSFPASDYTLWLGNRKGPGRISSTAKDLLKWDRALYGNRLILASALQQAFQPMKLNNDSLSNYGFGWMLQSDRVLGKIVMHTGDNPGYRTQIIRMMDKKRTLILLCNNEYANIPVLVEEIIKAWN